MKQPELFEPNGLNQLPTNQRTDMKRTYADFQLLVKNSAKAITKEDVDAPVEPGAEKVSLTPHQDVLKRLGVLVHGYLEGSRKIVAFSEHLGKSFEISQIERYTIEHAIFDMGEQVEQVIDTSADTDPTMVSLKRVRAALSAEGGKKRLVDSNHLGEGIWEINGRLLMVGAGSLAIWNGELRSSRVPEFDGKLVDFGGSEPWFDFDELAEMLEKSKESEWCQATLSEAVDLFSRWDNWVYESNADIAAALVCCTWIQSVWDWRPQIAIAGPSGCGKSMLLERTLPALFGPLSLACSKPSEAGLRQAIGHTSRVILIDEFEHDKHRQAILEVFRTSSRGSQILRGTAGGQKAMRFGYKQIPWFGAIESGLKKAADRNRCITLDMSEVSQDVSHKRLVVPSTEELHNLGMRLLTVAIRHWRSAKAVNKELISHVYAEIDPRIVESFSVPVSMIGAVMGMNVAECRSLMEIYFGERDFTTQAEKDEQRLLCVIYESVVWLKKGGRATVSELLQSQSHDYEETPESALNRVGLKTVRPYGNDPESVFFNSRQICRELLKDSDFRDMQIEQILMRVDCAKQSRQRMGGHLARGVKIPSEVLVSLLGDPDSPDSSGQDDSDEHSPAHNNPNNPDGLF